MSPALRGHVDVVRLLINAKADVNAKSNKGWSALMNAAQNGHVDVVRME
jgi:ankyrin repeat protein